MIYTQYLAVLLLLCGSLGNTGSYSIESSIGLLRWAPLRLNVKPYLTFLNHFYYNTWRTRHPMTMEKEELRHLQLPRGEPFALACGACFRRSSTPANLTIEVTGHEYYNVPKTQRSGEVQKYRVNYLDCLLSYALTEPIQTFGRITCTLNRGGHKTSDSISFSAVDVGVDEASEEIVIPNNGDNVELHCPSPKEPASFTNPLMYVWHEDPNPGARVIADMSPVITLPSPRYTRHVVCSVYNIGSPSKVYRTHYKITGSHTASQHQHQVSGEIHDYDEDAKLSSQGRKLPTAIIGLIAAAVVIIAIIIFIGMYQLCTAATRG